MLVFCAGGGDYGARFRIIIAVPCVTRAVIFREDRHDYANREACKVASFAKFFFIATPGIPEEFSVIEARDRIGKRRGWEVGRD